MCYEHKVYKFESYTCFCCKVTTYYSTLFNIAGNNTTFAPFTIFNLHLIYYINKIMTLLQIFLNSIFLFFFFFLYNFSVKSIILCKYFYFEKILPKEFIQNISTKMKLKNIFSYLFSFNFFKIYTLTFLSVFIANLIFYHHYNDFIYPDNYLALFFWVFYITICSNISSCYVYKKYFFSRINMCFIFYNFIILFSAKLSVLYIMPIILSCLFDCNNLICKDLTSKDLTCKAIQKYIDVNKNIMYFLKKVPIVNKLLFNSKSINNNDSLIMLNSKFKNNNYIGYCNKYNYRYNNNYFLVKISPFFTFYNNNNPIRISSLSSIDRLESRIMITYSERLPFISIDKLSQYHSNLLETNFYFIRNIGFIENNRFFYSSASNNTQYQHSINNLLITWPTSRLLDSPSFYPSLLPKINIVDDYSTKTVDSINIYAGQYKDSFINSKSFFIDSIFYDNNKIGNLDYLNPIVYMMSSSDQDNEGDIMSGSNKDDDGNIMTIKEMLELEGNSYMWQEDIFNFMINQESTPQNQVINNDNKNILSDSFYNTDTIDFANIASSTSNQKTVNKTSNLYKDLFIYEKDLIEVGKCIDLITKKGPTFEERRIYTSIKDEYEAFFDEDSGNDHLNGFCQVNDYIVNEINAIIDKINSDKYKYSYFDYDDPMWKKLGFSSITHYHANKTRLFNNLCDRHHQKNTSHLIDSVEFLEGIEKNLVIKRVKDLHWKIKRKLQDRKAIVQKFTEKKDQI